MAMWNPWRGCHKCSEGCKFCYIHKGDLKRGIDTNNIVKTEKFTTPIDKNKKGEYRIKSGQLVFLCFLSDFLLADADQWREECWDMIKERSDLHFLFLTKRIDRFAQCIPADWNGGYKNVAVGGESDYNARPFDYDWVLSLRQQCVNTNTNFEFRQCGTNFIKDGIQYKLNVRQLCSQAKKAEINYYNTYRKGY